MSLPPQDDLKNIQDKKNVFEKGRENDEIRLKFFEIQTDLLPLTSFTSLFETLIKRLEKVFGLPHIWLSFIDGSDKINLIPTLSSSDFLKQRLSVVEEKVFRDIFKGSTTPILFNKDTKALHRLYPKGENYSIRSFALVPLSFSGTIIGSLNQGDTAEGRYQPGMDTTGFEQLTKVVSTCLSSIAAYEELKLNASRDHLTGLLNRRVMESALDREFKRALRYGDSLSLIILDMDDLKVINDGHGHDAGDTVLKYLGQKLLEMSRESDIVIRFGGDEFVLILPGTNSARARETIERLQDYFANNPMRWGDTTLSVSFCYGLAEIRDDSVHDTASLLKQADLLLYEAKRNINTSLDRNAKKQVYFKNERPFLVDHVGNEAASNLTNRRYLHPDSKKVMSVNEKTYLPSQNDTVNGSKSSTAKLYEGLIRIQTRLVQQTKDGKPVSVSNISMVAEKVVALPEMIDALFNEAMFNPHEGEELALHSVIVFIYLLKLAQGLNCPNTKLVELGTSALAMDLGMFMLPQAYLAAKQDDLTPYEIDLIKRHPSLGYDLISEAGRKYKWLADVVRQTHEREDGSGYPRRLKGDQIHEYAKILAVTDTFVAMTHNRPYRPALLGFKAIQEILHSFKEKFDPRVLKLLLTQLTVFPLKSYVKLNNSAIGMVVKTNEAMLLNPTIRVLFDGQGRQVDEEKVMDLSKSPYLYVSEVVEEADLGRQYDSGLTLYGGTKKLIIN